MTARLLVNAGWPGAGRDDVRTVVSAGADGLGLPDSPRLFDDPFVASERVLAGTGAALAGPCVVGLGLRPAATVGAGLRTLADEHGERVFGVLARGESSVRNENLPVPSLARYLADVETVLDVLGPVREDVTLLGAASGPRTITATAALLGGVLIDVGVDPEVVAAAIDTARRAHPQVRCWLFVRAVVTEDDAASRVAIATLLGSCAARLAASPDWYRIPAEHRDGVSAIAAAHDYRRHGRDPMTDHDTADTTAHDLVRQRFFLTGAAASIAARLPAADLDGVVLAGATGGLRERLTGTIVAVRAGLS